MMDNPNIPQIKKNNCKQITDSMLKKVEHPKIVSVHPGANPVNKQLHVNERTNAPNAVICNVEPIIKCRAGVMFDGDDNSLHGSLIYLVAIDNPIISIVINKHIGININKLYPMVSNIVLRDCGVDLSLVIIFEYCLVFV